MNSRRTGDKLPGTHEGTGGDFCPLSLTEVKASPLFDIVDERKRNAGGVCPGGSSG